MFPEILKESIGILKKNINLMQLFFILYIVFTLLSPMFVNLKFNISAILLFILFFALFSATMAGMFFAFKKSMDYRKNPPITKNDYELSPLYFSEFLQGVGTYTAKFAFSGIFLIAILLLIFAFGYYFLTHYAVMPDTILKADFSEIFSSEIKLNEFLKGLSVADLNKITKIVGFLFVIMSAFGVLTMLYPVALVKEEANFFKSFIISLKVLFKNIFVTTVLFIFFNFLITVFSCLSAISVNNLFIGIIAILLQCWLNVLYILALFVYYEKVR